MDGVWTNLHRAPVAFGRLAVPQLFAELEGPEPVKKLRALASLHDLIHDPQRLYQTLTGGYVEKMVLLLEDEEQSVRTKACDLLCLLCTHSLGRQVVLSSSILSALFRLLSDASSSCRRSVLKVLKLLTLHPSGAEVLLPLVPNLLLRLQQQEEKKGRTVREGGELHTQLEEVKEEMKVKEEVVFEKNGVRVKEVQEEEHRNVENKDIEDGVEEEEELLLLCVIGRCSQCDARPALSSAAVSVAGARLTHTHTLIRRAAAAAMMALSVPVEGKLQLCEQTLLPLLVDRLHDNDVEVRTIAAGVLMNTVMITAGKLQCLELSGVSLLLELLREAPLLKDGEEEEEKEEEELRKRRKPLLLYCLRALTSLAEAPEGRRLLKEQLPVLRRWEEEEEEEDITRAARTAISVVTWTP